MIIAALAQTIVVEQRDSWAPALFASFAGALAGAGLGGWFTRHERLRGARSSLYLDLYDFHDEANDRRTAVRDKKEPLDTGFNSETGGNLGKMFRAFDRDAATASRFDSETVRAIWAQLNAIEAVNRKYAQRGDIPNDEAKALAVSTATEQLALWDALHAYLWRYRRWLEWKATRGLLWLMFNRRPETGESDPEDPPQPPRTLR
jgi:hypothetical protein